MFKQMELPPLILASSSPRREQLLRQLDLEFQVMPADVEESTSEHLSPRELAQLNAYRKCHAVAKDHRDNLVLGADTVVCMKHRIFGKPADLEEAAHMLGELEGRSHQVITGVCLIHSRSHTQRLFHVTSLVRFKRLDALSVRHYLSLINPLDKAGGYAVQEHSDLIIETVSGSISNVIGLPMEKLFEILEHWPTKAA